MISTNAVSSASVIVNVRNVCDIIRKKLNEVCVNYWQRSSNLFCADLSIAIKVPDGDLSHNAVN